MARLLPLFVVLAGCGMSEVVQGGKGGGHHGGVGGNHGASGGGEEAAGGGDASGGGSSASGGGSAAGGGAASGGGAATGGGSAAGGGAATGGGSGAMGAMGGGTGTGGGAPAGNVTFAPSCSGDVVCGGWLPNSSWKYTQACLVDTLDAQVAAMCASATVTDKTGTLSGHLLFGGAGPGGRDGTLTTSFTAVFPATCAPTCTSFGATLPASWGTASCASSAQGCRCVVTKSTDLYASAFYDFTSNTFAFNSLTFDFCIDSQSMQVTETTPGSPQGVFTLSKQ